MIHTSAATPVSAVVSLGSNIEPERNISRALAELRAKFGDLRVSPAYRTSTVGFEGPPFINLVVAFETVLAVAKLIEELQAIEVRGGRVRGEKTYSNRTLDLDVVLYGEADLRSQGYNIPRDEIERCAYVLYPLSDLLPEAQHPLLHRSYAELRQQFNEAGQVAKCLDLTF